MALSVPTGTSLPSWPGTVTINTLSRMPELISQHSAHFHAWIHYPAASPSALGKNDPFLLT